MHMSDIPHPLANPSILGQRSGGLVLRLDALVLQEQVSAECTARDVWAALGNRQELPQRQSVPTFPRAALPCPCLLGRFQDFQTQVKQVLPQAASPYVAGFSC